MEAKEGTQTNTSLEAMGHMGGDWGQDQTLQSLPAFA